MALRGASSLGTIAAVAAWLAGSGPACALVIELKDVAADRVERQRAAAAGRLPLPGTPNVAVLQERLREKGVSITSPIAIRIFKAESDLEIWKERGGIYVLFATYPICHWSGSLGPKLRDGDKQAPEGFYSVDRAKARHVGRWPVSIDIGFPNILDQLQARTGSDILIHGGCSSIGCFAMTNPVMDEIHQLTIAAIEAGQQEVPVAVFPFRMNNANMTANLNSPWMVYWSILKQGYDIFERTQRPPTVSICNGRYQFRETPAGQRSGPLEACEPTLAAIRDQDQWLKNVPPPSTMLPRPPPPATTEVQTSIESERKQLILRFSWPLVR